MRRYRMIAALAVVVLGLSTSLSAAESFRDLIEADWLKQANAWAAIPPGTYPTTDVLERGRHLAADLRRAGIDTQRHERELDKIEAQCGQSPPAAKAESVRRFTSGHTGPCGEWHCPIRC